ncbi:UNVERIFIED_CONTAM: hypothetical protein Sradi_5724400 [Sesamum radiatum]|uniref:DUF4216 domain-containing protein n=1 Tax=Sesamum radiatum TaxID=300843 RepID=A0AAW2L4S8_SESRA
MRNRAKDETFTMHAALMWTVNDLPAYGMASEWITASITGCPACMKDTLAFYLQNGRKRATLTATDSFSPWIIPIVGIRKHSLRIEQRESIFNTMMDIKGKMKDNLNARKNLKIICIGLELEGDERSSNVMPKAVYTLTKEHKRRIREWITHLKFSNAYASNLVRCVDMKELRLNGMKSHDYIDMYVNRSFLNELYEKYHLKDPVIEELVNTQFKDWFKRRVKTDLNYTDNDLLKLHYWGHTAEVDPLRGMKVHPHYHLVDVNFKVYQKNEPFILAQQAGQVYYTKYPSMKRDKMD